MARYDYEKADYSHRTTSSRNRVWSPLRRHWDIVMLALIIVMLAGSEFVEAFYTILIPVIYGIFGFLVGIIAAAIYNLVAKWTGGLEFEVRDIHMAN